MAGVRFEQEWMAEVGQPFSPPPGECAEVCEVGTEVACAPLSTAPVCGAGGARSGADVDMWVHSKSGMSFPRLSMLSYAATTEDYERLAEGETRRGLTQGDLELARDVRRPIAETRQLEAFCEWLAAFELNILGTVTFRPEYAAGHGVVGLRTALRDVARSLAALPPNKGERKGFRGRYVLSGEWGPQGRMVPHVHLALQSPAHRVAGDCSDLFRYFSRWCGRCRFEPMRDVDTATLYGLKDTVKAGSVEADTLILRLARQR